MLKRVAGTLCILLLLSALVCACAEEAPQLWEYYFNGEGGISLTHYLGQETDITLPDTVDGFTVTEVVVAAYDEAVLRYKSGEVIVTRDIFTHSVADPKNSPRMIGDVPARMDLMDRIGTLEKIEKIRFGRGCCGLCFSSFCGSCSRVISYNKYSDSGCCRWFPNVTDFS
jgi:hypothetical protein